MAAGEIKDSELKQRCLADLQLIGLPGFRSQQWEAIESVLVHRRSAVLATGTSSGKSMTFFLHGLRLRPGQFDIVLMPTIDLMAVQKQNTERLLAKLLLNVLLQQFARTTIASEQH